MEASKKRRNVIKRLDFENCEVTTVTLRKRLRKRVRAKLTIESHDDDDNNGDDDDDDNNKCLNDRSTSISLQDSPILLRKTTGKKKSDKSPSPILLAKRTLKKEGKTKICESPDPSASTSTSPVFTFKTSGKRQKITQCTPREAGASGIIKKEPTIDEDDEKELEDSCSIQEFTPRELSKEAKILSFSSDSKPLSDAISDDNSRDDIHSFATPSKEEETDEIILDSVKKRKRLKKGGLVSRLVELRKRQASEKRIREHTKKIMKAGENRRKTLRVVECWKDGTRTTLKCQQLDVAQENNEFLYLILNRDRGYHVRRIGKGAFIRISAPWKELRLATLNSNILLSVDSIEPVDEAPGTLTPKTEIRKISISEYKEDESAFFRDLLASKNSAFFS